MTTNRAPRTGRPVRSPSTSSRAGRHRCIPAASSNCARGTHPDGCGCVIVMLPIYWIVITSFKTQSNFFATNPLAPARRRDRSTTTSSVLQSDFIQYFVNSVIVTVGAVVPAVLISFMAAFAIVRGRQRLVPALTNSMFLHGPRHPAAGRRSSPST